MSQKSSIRFFAAAVLGSGLALSSLPAHAWGEREQGILTGIAASYLWREIHDDRPRERVVVRPAPAPVVIEQPPRVIYRESRGADVVVVREHPGKGRYYGQKSRGYDDGCRSITVKNSRGRVLEYRLVCDD